MGTRRCENANKPKSWPKKPASNKNRGVAGKIQLKHDAKADCALQLKMVALGQAGRIQTNHGCYQVKATADLSKNATECRQTQQNEIRPAEHPSGSGSLPVTKLKRTKHVVDTTDANKKLLNAGPAQKWTNCLGPRVGICCDFPKRRSDKGPRLY